MEKKPILPEELMIAILLQVRIKSVFRFKSICKSWQSLITSPSFTTRYCHISNTKNKEKILCYRLDPITKLHLISLLDCQTTENIVDFEWPPFPDEGVDNKEEYSRRISILGPVNGIYCVYNRLIESWIGTLVLWNPTTREFNHIIPPISYPFSREFLGAQFGGTWSDHDEWKRPLSFGIGFGYDNMTNDFKVVVICHWDVYYGYEDERWHVRVYNLFTNSWRTIYYLRFNSNVLPMFQASYPNFPSISSYPEFSNGFLNNVFHWSSRWLNHFSRCEGILAFDMSDESFKLMKGPPVPESEDLHQSIWVFKDTLAMVISATENNENPNGATMWMMTEYGAENSWAMLYTFGPTAGLSIVGLPIDDHIFFHDDKGQLISSNFQDGKFKEYGVRGVCESSFYRKEYESLGAIRYAITLEALKRRHQQ